MDNYVRLFKSMSIVCSREIQTMPKYPSTENLTELQENLKWNWLIFHCYGNYRHPFFWDRKVV